MGRLRKYRNIGLTALGTGFIVGALNYNGCFKKLDKKFENPIEQTQNQIESNNLEDETSIGLPYNPLEQDSIISMAKTYTDTSIQDSTISDLFEYISENIKKPEKNNKISVSSKSNILEKMSMIRGLIKDENSQTTSFENWLGLNPEDFYEVAIKKVKGGANGEKIISSFSADINGDKRDEVFLIYEIPNRGYKDYEIRMMSFTPKENK